ncbi:MAG: RNA polymerase sigma factor [Oscillospiraceae bacterium]|nr:RNA polymerase sigma factor [Oscillospiraceae bacterium]
MVLIFLTFPNEYEKSKFEYIYDKYKKLLLYKANAILNDYSLAEDAVSEAFLRVYKNLHKIDDPDSGMTVSFLVVIVKNTAINILNQNKDIPVSNYDMYDMSENDWQSDFNVEEEVVSEIVTEAMLKLVDKLKDELKDCFLLMYAHNLSYKEIGKILHISEDNVAVRIHRAKKRLIELLKEGNYI